MTPTAEERYEAACKAALATSPHKYYDTLDKVMIATIRQAYEDGKRDEREACALTAEAQYEDAPSTTYDNGGTTDGWHLACDSIATANRARTQSEPSK